MDTTCPLPQFVHDLVASPPRRGAGLNVWFFRAARVLHTYRDEHEIIELLRAATAGEAVLVGEIERAVARSKASAWMPGSAPAATPAPRWPRINLEQREAVTSAGEGLVDLWETSPIQIGENDADPDDFINALFPGNPLLCVGRSAREFATRSREDWRGHLAEMAMIVPSPMASRYGDTQDGKRSEHTLSNTGPRRFLVVEQDTGAVDEQAAVLLHLATVAPLALAVHSGGKSIHGWFMAEGQSEERLRQFMCLAVTLGADPATWTRSQFVRMPGGTRDDGNRQSVFFFNPGVIQ